MIFVTIAALLINYGWGVNGNYCGEKVGLEHQMTLFRFMLALYPSYEENSLLLEISAL